MVLSLQGAAGVIGDEREAVAGRGGRREKKKSATKEGVGWEARRGCGGAHGECVCVCACARHAGVHAARA